MTLIDVDDYKAAMGIDNDDHDDAYEFAIEAASIVITNFTDRDFATEEVTEARTFPVQDRPNDLDCVLTVDIDDAKDIISVDTLSDNQWAAYGEGPAAAMGVLTYLEIAHGRTASAAMGFTRNEDVFGNWPFRSISVTAIWGWPDVPADVQQATIWAVNAIVSDFTDPEGHLAAKGVAEVFENYVQPAQQGITSANDNEPLPSRSRALLLPYRRVSM